MFWQTEGLTVEPCVVSGEVGWLERRLCGLALVFNRTDVLMDKVQVPRREEVLSILVLLQLLDQVPRIVLDPLTTTLML